MLGRLVVGAHGRGDHPGPETVGPKVLAEVFERVAGPVAESETRGAWRRGWRLLAIDGFDGAAALAAAFTAAFATLAPATRARHLAAQRSALGWWRARGWLAGDPTAGWARPKIARDHSRALTRERIAARWRLDVGLREKTLWRLLRETAARATEILTLDIGDLDRPGKRARVISKGGDTDWVYYQTGTALLLPRLLTGRTRGPVFLAELAPTPGGAHPGPVPRHRPGPTVLPPRGRTVRTRLLEPGTNWGRSRRQCLSISSVGEAGIPAAARANRLPPLAFPNLSRSPARCAICA